MMTKAAEATRKANMKKTTIEGLAPGQGGIIESVGGEGELRDRLLDMGLTPGTYVLMRKAAPMGDPVQLSLRGYELTIRKADAARIGVSLAAGFSCGGCGADSACGMGCSEGNGDFGA
ncbi:MAG: ferrous iron transport protein A [Clostridiales bacterium]|nr:ferrous iron transport protein A [Clostridiales bacterium]